MPRAIPKPDEKNNDMPKPERVVKIFTRMEPDERVEAFEELLSTWCISCGEETNDEGECPNGCEDDEAEGDEGDPDEDEDEDDASEEDDEEEDEEEDEEGDEA